MHKLKGFHERFIPGTLPLFIKKRWNDPNDWEENF